MKAICKVEKGYAWPTSPDPLSLDEWGGMIKWRIFFKQVSQFSVTLNTTQNVLTLSLISHLLCFICLPVCYYIRKQIFLEVSRKNHNNIFYFVKRQIMLTWGQNSIKVPLRFRKLYKIYYSGCYHPFLYQYFIYASALYFTPRQDQTLPLNLWYLV